jgi:putative DNA primase/helicase
MLCADLIKPALGSYYKELDASYYTQATKSGAATPDMANKEYSRVLVASEPETSEKLQSAKIKGLTGLEPINSRPLYKDTLEWTPQFTPIMLCNEKPDFNKFDNAIAQRVKLIPFTSKFVDNPKLSFEYLLNKNLKCELNDDIDESIRQSFMYILLEHYESNITINDDIISLEATQEFIDSQNPLNDFIKTHLQKDNAEDALYNDVYEEYKFYYTSGGFENNKMMNKINFSKCLKINNIEVKKKGIKNISYILYHKLIKVVKYEIDIDI